MICSHGFGMNLESWHDGGPRTDDIGSVGAAIGIEERHGIRQRRDENLRERVGYATCIK